jgi:hypothetical protein
MKNINHTSPSQLGKAPVAGKANTSSDKKKQDVKVLLNKYNWEKVFFEIAAKTGCEWETESNEGSAKEITHHIATLTSNRD